MIKDLKIMLFDKNINLYDYVANNYYKLSKEELTELLLNVIYELEGRNDLKINAIKNTIERLND